MDICVSSRLNTVKQIHFESQTKCLLKYKTEQLYALWSEKVLSIISKRSICNIYHLNLWNIWYLGRLYYQHHTGKTLILDFETYISLIYGGKTFNYAVKFDIYHENLLGRPYHQYKDCENDWFYTLFSSYISWKLAFYHKCGWWKFIFNRQIFIIITVSAPKTFENHAMTMQKV